MNIYSSIKNWENWESSKKEFSALFIILFFSFLLRIINLDDLSLWMDEYVHVGHAKSILNENSSLFGGELNGILYTLFVVPLFAIFGETVFWARFPSVIFGVGSVWMTWIIGREFYNRPVGFISAVITAFSLYHIYWSRLSRNYAIFSFFFLVLLFVIWKAISLKDDEKGGLDLKKNLNYKYLKWVPIAFLASLFSHLLTVTVILSLAAFFLGYFIYSYYATKKIYWLNFVFAIPSLLLLLFLLTPYFSEIFGSFLGFFLPERIVGMISLDWERVDALWKLEPFGAFLVYWNVLFHDLYFGLIIGISGLLLSFLWSFRTALFHFSGFIIPLFFMSFIFREPNEPRYLIFLYPLFSLYIAVGIVFISRSAVNFFPEKLLYGLKSGRLLLTSITILIVISSGNAMNIASLITVENTSGNVVNPALSSWFFTNWKDVLEESDEYIDQDDLVMSTVPGAVKYYLDRSDVIHFRQFNFDGKTKDYEMNPISGDSISAQTTFDFKETVEKHSKGWLFADYYFHNILTDASARNFVYHNFHFHPELSKNGDVQVYSWDNEKGKPKDQNIIIQLGPYRVNSEPYFFDNNDIQKVFKIRISGVDSFKEAYIVFNEDYNNPISIPPNKDDSIRLLEGKIDSQLLFQGKNKVEFFYNGQVEYDPHRGFVIYMLEIIDKS